MHRVRYLKYFLAVQEEREHSHSHSHSHSHNGVPCTADHSLSPSPASAATSPSLVLSNQQPQRFGDSDDDEISNWAMITRMFKWLVEGPGGITSSAACLTLIILTKVWTTPLPCRLDSTHHPRHHHTKEYLCRPSR
jgi:hypothetical protein